MKIIYTLGGLLAKEMTTININISNLISRKLYIVFLFLLSTTVFCQTTRLVKDFNGNFTSSFGGNGSGIVTSFDDKVLVTYENDALTWELWVSDGETEGTLMVDALSSGEKFIQFISEPDQEVVYYTVSNGDGSTIKALNKTTLGVSILYDYPKEISFLTLFQGAIYFTGEVLDDNEDGLWKLNQTTAMIEPIYEFHWNGGIGDLVVWRNNLALIAATSNGDSLFLSDGTTEGTISFLQTNESNRIRSSHYLTAGDEKLYFFYEKSGEPYQLYVTDGTLEGTSALIDLEDYSIFTDPRNFRGIHIWNDHLFFRGQPLNSPSGAYELYISDGTSEGTFLYDFANSRGRPSYFTTYKNEVYFRADFGDGISTVYKSDGTLEGTQEAIDGFSFGNGFDFGGYSLTVHKEALFFRAYRSAPGGELWRSEGDTETTSMIEIVPGREGSEPWSLTSTDNYLFFLGKTPENGRELMVYSEENMSTPIRNIELDAKQWLIGPNPVGDRLYLKSLSSSNKPFIARLWTVNGEEIIQTENNKVLDVHTLTSGIYFMEIIEEGVSSFKKIIKQ